MSANKYLIVSINHDDYGRFIQDRMLPPGSCFQCESVEEARDTRAKNARWRIPCTIWMTPEWKAIHKSAATKEGAA